MIYKQKTFSISVFFFVAIFSFFIFNLQKTFAKEIYIEEVQSQMYQWSHVGKNQGGVDSSDSAIAINPQTKQPWIVFKDETRHLKVEKFNGEDWIGVGNIPDIVGSNDDTADNVRPKIVFNPITNEPYITFQVTDGFTDSIVRVKKFSGDIWVNVGSDIMDTDESVCSPEINFSKLNGELYLAVTGNGNDCNYYSGNGNNGDERDVRIYKFNSPNWVMLDMSGISTISKARAISFDIDSVGNLYVGVINKEATPDEVTVWKNDTVGWTNIANASNMAVNGNANDVSIKFDKNNFLWIATKSKKDGYDYIEVYKFDNLNITKIGENVFFESDGVSLKNKSRISLALDEQNNPIVSFVEKINSLNASFLSVKKFVDNNWSDVGVSRLYKETYSTNHNIDFLDDSLYATFNNTESNISVVNYSSKIVEVTDWWQPKGFEHLSWQWQLSVPIDTTLNVDMYDIDLFDVSENVITDLKNSGKTVICYISAGSIEYGSGRPDQQDLENISPSVIGNVMENWSSEKWLNINNTEVRNIMARRMDLALNKGCDGIEPDNINAWEVDATNDGYKTGFNITEQQQIDYNIWLANEAHKRGLSIGLKNDIGVDAPNTNHISKLVDYFDWALNEQCYKYNECNVYSVFDNANKAVFGVEYNLGVNDFCKNADAHGRYWMQKNIHLDEWRDACQQLSNKHKKTPIYRLYNTRTGAQLYTRGVADRDKILAKYPDFEFTDNIPAFYASLTDDGTTPIYRLYNRRTGAQLYTRGEADRDKILSKWYNFEFTDNMPSFYLEI